MIDKICVLTKKTMSEWKDPYGYAPNSAAKKLTNAMLPWIIELTECLRIWVDKDIMMTDGELILAKTNLGSLIESWLKFFLCVYYEDYLKNPIVNKSKIVEANKIKFEGLKNYCGKILWKQGDKWDVWIEKMQHQRNAIHSFNFKDIGKSSDFIKDIDMFFDFITLIIHRLPDSPESVREYY